MPHTDKVGSMRNSNRKKRPWAQVRTDGMAALIASFKPRPARFFAERRYLDEGHSQTTAHYSNERFLGNILEAHPCDQR